MGLVATLTTLPAYTAIATLLVLYPLTLVVYRLFFHPIAKFPGPKVAAATYWVEFYHDVVGKGSYTFRIAEMHERYGPVVRISPDELHVNDPACVDEVYAGAGKTRDKLGRFTRQFGYVSFFRGSHPVTNRNG